MGDFFEQALTFFGDPDPTLPGKGQRLAELVRQQHSLLILDGLEPLQAPPNATNAGQLLDPDLHDLLVALAQFNPGLCLLTSRQAVRDLAGLTGKASEVQDLDELPKETAVRLLRKMQITGTEKELEDACQKFGFHALSLTLLGRFLFDAHEGDIARIDRVRLQKADRLTRPERHRTAWHVLEAYDEWLNAAKADPTLLAVLRLVGLFDRPATADCLQELRTGEIIGGLTDAIHDTDRDKWNVLLKRLERAHLIRLRPSEKQRGEWDVDAHPLVREYFAEQLRTKLPVAFKEAHSRLFVYLCESTEYQPDTLAGLQPLYQAVTHGCLADRQQEACDDVYFDRILRGTGSDGYYSARKLGALGANLGAVAAFFEEPWSELSSNLSAPAQPWMLNEAAFSLRALGRLTEAAEPMRVGLDMCDGMENWEEAAIRASNLSELELTLGDLDAAVSAARRSINYAERGKDAFLCMALRTTAADALHQRGERDAARALFVLAEQMQEEWQPQFPLLYSVQGFRYVDLILSPAERAAWHILSRVTGEQTVFSRSTTSRRNALVAHGEDVRASAACYEATSRAEQTLKRLELRYPVLSMALDYLTLARASLYRAILETHHNPTHQRGSDPSPTTASESAGVAERSERPGSAADRSSRHRTACAAPLQSHGHSPDNGDGESITEHTDFMEATTQLQHAITGLRKSGDAWMQPRALLTAAMLESLRGDAGVTKALAHLAEAEQIATRGPMPLYLADIHLTRARIAGRVKREGGSLKVDVVAELKEARRLIEKHNYGRRKEELENAEAAAC